MKFFGPGADLADAYQVRTRVFVEEQGFSMEIEIDDTDPVASHVVLYDGGRPVATGRLFPREADSAVYIIGRVAVLAEYRGRQLGVRVMQELEREARSLGARELRLGAQCQAQGFYGKLGYTPFGEPYFEEHCQHMHMKKVL